MVNVITLFVVNKIRLAQCVYIVLNNHEVAELSMFCNDMELAPDIVSLLNTCKEKDISMYILSNSRFSGVTLSEALD